MAASSFAKREDKSPRDPAPPPPAVRLSWNAVLAAVAAAALVACSSSGGGGGGQGGSGGTATGGSIGSTGTGGGSGGAAGQPGAAGTGGAAGRGGSGGVAATGGSAGTGGATGGAPGQGGSGGKGGAGGGAAGHGGNAGSGGNGGAAGAPSSCPAAAPLTGGKQVCATSSSSNPKGTADGSYSYELWTDGTGSGCMTVYGTAATFSATWTNVGDLLARVGLQFDQTKTPAQIGTISSDFAETKTADSGLVYVGIYGWTVNPLREYYIIDDWGSSKPADTASDGSPRTHVGTITVDGDTYDVWKHTRTNKPNITGTDQTFDQYYSVRQNARQCGHISISQHFSQWTSLGLQLGKLEEAKLLLEAQSSSGKIDFTTATVVLQ